MKFKKFAAAAIAALMVTSILVSCSQTETQDPQETEE